MKLALLFLTFIFCSLSADDNTSTVELKIETLCGADEITNTLFKYKEYRERIKFTIKDPKNLTGILPHGENTNKSKSVALDIKSFYDASGKRIDTYKKYDYSHVPYVDYFIKNSNLSIPLITHHDSNLSSDFTYMNIPRHYSLVGNDIKDISISTKKNENITFFSHNYADGIRLIEKITLGENVRFVAKYDLLEGKVTKIKKEAREGFSDFEFKIINNNFVKVKVPLKMIEVDELQESVTPFVKDYKIIYDANLLHKTQSECEQRIALHKSYFRNQDVGITLGSILAIGLLVLFTKLLFSYLKNKTTDLKQKAHEYKVKKIAEDEAIRATVKKAVDEDSEDSKELQELINKAVAKGDTETAQSLLAILERRKTNIRK